MINATKRFHFPVILFFFIQTLFSCSTTTEKPKPDPEETTPNTSFNQYEKSELTVKVFKIDSVEVNGSRGWGYDILVDGNIYIHQPNVPAVMGNNGFSSEEKAKKTGDFIIQKIRNNIIPPAVTPEELDSLDVLN